MLLAPILAIIPALATLSSWATICCSRATLRLSSSAALTFIPLRSSLTPWSPLSPPLRRIVIGSRWMVTLRRRTEEAAPCWTTWVSSWARRCWPPGEEMSGAPSRNHTWLPLVNALAWMRSLSCFDSPPVWTRTPEKSAPNAPSIDARTLASSGLPPAAARIFRSVPASTSPPSAPITPSIVLVAARRMRGSTCRSAAIDWSSQSVAVCGGGSSADRRMRLVGPTCVDVASDRTMRSATRSASASLGSFAAPTIDLRCTRRRGGRATATACRAFASVCPSARCVVLPRRSNSTGGG